MQDGESVKLVTLLMVVALVGVGYLITSQVNAELAGTAGKVTISPDVTIRQGNGVNYSFSEVAVIDKLEVKSASIEINDNFEIGAVTSSGYLSNELISYDPSGQIRWIGTSTDSTASVTYTVSGLLANTNYEVWVDGSKVKTLGADSSGSVQYTYLGTWSTHEFIIQKSSAPVTQVQAAFEYRISSNTIYFTDKSYNGPVVWVWNFGDGFGSTSQNPTHDYKHSGVFVVSLTVYDSEARSSIAQTSIEIVLGPDNPIEQDEGGWNVYLSDTLIVSVRAIGLIITGAIMFITGMFLNLPIISNNGRKVLGMLLIAVGAYYFIFVDNSWLNNFSI